MADDADDGDVEGKYAQAIRFLTSLQSQKNQDRESQRTFLRNKGLSDEVIARAFEDVKRPNTISEEIKSHASGAWGSDQQDCTDEQAFEKAAQMFDEPLKPSSTSSSTLSESGTPLPPPKTYPRSPLALYQQQQQQYDNQLIQQGRMSMDSPLTRYDVLLSFFRSLSYFLVLGGGVTGVVVALYRTYLLPRIMSTLDSRSFLLKHHLEQFNVLTNRIRNLRASSLSPASQQSLSSAVPLKGVLKKVQFADDVTLANDEKSELVEGEGDKAPSEKEEESASLLVDEAEVDAAQDQSEGTTGTPSEQQRSDVGAANIMLPVQTVFERLGQSLQADMTASAVDTAIEPPSTTSSGSVRSATVEEESDIDSWVSEEDSDELEFDPYAPPSTLPKTSKRKHDPAKSRHPSSSSSTSSRAAAAAAAAAAKGTSATSLHSSLSAFNAYVNSQTFMAGASVYGGRTMGMGGMSVGSTGSDKETRGAGDVAQVRADIRNLKGLLLSRRNFPTFRPQTSSPTPAPAQAAETA